MHFWGKSKPELILPFAQAESKLFPGAFKRIIVCPLEMTLSLHHFTALILLVFDMENRF